jgi:RNA polymerase sigma-70 factor (ECF subfamily)
MTPEQYNQSVSLYSDSLYRFALKTLRHIPDAEDVVQQCYEVLWLKINDVTPEKAKAFLFQVGYNKSMDILRKVKRMVFVDTLPNEPIAQHTTDKHTKQMIEKALNTLPQIQKTLILLKDYEGYNYNEMAQITNLSEEQVKVYLYRGRMAIKKFVVQLENII